MSRIPPLDLREADGPVRRAHDAHLSRHGRITNMKRTLLRSLPAFQSLMTWYDLRDAVQPFLGERLSTLFAHAVSSESDCLICSTFFRRILAEQGEDPDHLELSERDQSVIAYGRCLARPGFRVPDATFTALRRWLDADQVVALTAFGALMVATNIINNALEVPLDEYLESYRRVPA